MRVIRQAAPTSNLSTTDKVQFRDTGIYINSSVDGQLDIVADTEIQIAATTVDLNGNLDVSGTALVTGVLTTTAATVHTNGITMPDNAKAIFGAGSDLEIFSNGTSSYIIEGGSGNLEIRATDIFLKSADNTKALATFDADGAASISHNGSTKLATSASGIDVTGTVTADGLTVDGNPLIQGAQPYITITDSVWTTGATLRSGVNTLGTAIGDYFLINAPSGKGVSISTNNSNNLATFAAGGDISFYEDTGTTAKLTWSASNESLTFGTNLAITTNEIDVATGDLTLDVAGDIILDAAGGDVIYHKAGGDRGRLISSDDGFTIRSDLNNGDLIFKGVDGGLEITALTLDMSEAGAATFNSSVRGTQLEAYKTNHGGDVSVAANQVGNAYENLASTASLILGATSTSTINSTKIVADHSGGATNNHVQDLVFYPVGGSSNNFEAMRISSLGALTVKNVANGHTVFNENGVDADFRVESDSNANMLFVDGGANAVGIGTSTPGAYYAGAEQLVVYKASGEGGITIATASDTSGALYFADGTTGAQTYQGGIGYNHSNSSLSLVEGGVANINFGATEYVFNETSLDRDFRVESNDNANMLFVDGGANHVNIGTATDLNGVLNVDGNLSLSGAGTSNRYVGLMAETSTYAGTLMLQAGGGSAAYGAAVVMHGHSHATNPGMLWLAGSSGAGGKSVVIGRNGNNATAASEMLTAYSNGTELVLNEFGNTQNFRVESDNNANMLIVDGGADLVAISGGSKVTNEVLRVNGAQVVGSDASGVYTVGLNEIFAASAAKYLRIQQDGSIYGGLTITATGDYSNVNAIGCFQKIYSIGANSANTTLFSAGNTTVADLGATSGQFSMGTPTKPNATTIYIPLENLNASYILDMSITVEFRGRIGGISSIDILDA